MPTARRPLLLTAAIVFAAATIVYSAAWMYYVRIEPRVELGIDTTMTPTSIEIAAVQKESPAEAAGLRPGDRILGINGRPLKMPGDEHSQLMDVWLRGHPGDTVNLTIQRAGQAQPLSISAVFRAARPPETRTPIARAVAEQIKGSFPVLFLIVGLVVLFLRVNDRNAWLLALVLAGVITVSDTPGAFALVSPAFQAFLLGYRGLFNGLLPALFYFFFTVFPTRSPIDRKVPWLKWLAITLGVLFGLAGVTSGSPQPFPALIKLLGNKPAQDIRLFYSYGTTTLGLVALVWNAVSISSVEERRKLNVILWGTLVGITPAVVTRAVVDFAQTGIPFWVDFVVVLLVFLFPLSFAYAVAKHRVLEIPVLLKRSARYFLVERGFLVLIVVISVVATLMLTETFSGRFSAGSKAAIPVGASFGVLLISAATQVHRKVRRRLDRAFFRNAYDAQQVLEDLAARTLGVSSREGLAALLEEKIDEALHPQSLFIFLETNDGLLRAQGKGLNGTILPRDVPVLKESEQDGHPFEVEPGAVTGTPLEELQPECIVPIRGSGNGRLQGTIVLGPRLSEELYSTGDKRLLASVASQAGIAMRSISLAENMAARMEAERRAAQEMQIARQVQTRLLPQQAPQLESLECVGHCIQTRAVGGDYYDFLDLGSGRLGLVLADISGKGISAALLMANLQANLRSQYALALEDIPRLLRSVNRLFYKNTESNHYATAFFALYEEEQRRLRWVNCGHNPPLVIRAGGQVERLQPTATVLGLFEEWDCAPAELALSPGDTLVIYTDGVSEAAGEDGDEFGEERLIEAVRSRRGLSASEILDAVIGELQSFSRGEQGDDITLVVARAVVSG